MKPKICIVVSNFYPEISKMLIDGASTVLRKKKITNFKIIKTPGTFEIPVIISSLINQYDAFIVLGCVIKGKTSHFKFLCSSVFQSIVNLTVSSKKPIGNGILTCDNKKQAKKRADPKSINKGADAANAAIAVLNILK